MKKLTKLIALSCAIAGPQVAFAAPQAFSWMFTSDGNNAVWSGAEGTTDNASVAISNATAWANTGGTATGGATTDGSANALYGQQTFSGSTTNSLRIRSTLNGVSTTNNETNLGEPDHAIDNKGPQEFALFEFNSAITLNSLSISWPSSGYDTDVTVLAYKGNGAPDLATLDSTTADGMLGDSDAWEAIHFEANEFDENGGVTDFAASTASRYWLVGAYNQHIGGAQGIGADATGYAKVDALKIKGLGGSYTPPGGGGNIPEPSSLSLLALAMVGGLRRWKRAPST